MLSWRHKTRLWVALVPLTLGGACTEGLEIDSDVQAIVSPSNAYRGRASTSAIPNVEERAGGLLLLSRYNETDERHAHWATYTNLRNLRDAPVPADEEWLADVAGDGFNAAPGFDDRLAEALASAREDVESGLEGVGDGFDFIDALGVDIDIRDLEHASYGYTPERARWMRAQWTDRGCKYASCPRRRYRYEDPVHYDEIRQRGARMFCAAREAVHQAPDETVVMGRHPSASITILGKQIDFLVFEPTMAMQTPEKFLNHDVNDGTQAFSIPFQLGTRIQPISLLPSLPEVRVPVTLVTGDSEMANAAEWGILSGAPTIFPPGGKPFGNGIFGNKGLGFGTSGKLTLPKPRFGYYKDWQTVSHADAFVTGRRGVGVEAPGIPLFAIGPVGVKLRLGFDMDVGESQAPNTRLLDRPAGVPYAAPRTGGWTTESRDEQAQYYDGAWKLSRYWPGPSNTTVRTDDASVLTELHLPPESPFLIRALQNNDKSLKVRAKAEITALLEAGLHWRWRNFLEINVTVAGGVGGGASQYHTVREHETIGLRTAPGVEFPSPHPETAITVTPSTEASLDFVGRADLLFRIRLPIIGWINLGGNLFNHRSNIARTESGAWSEESRMRIGTSAPRGDTMNKPTVHSHWPGQPEYLSFPDDVDTCLGGTAPVAPTPAPCGSKPVEVGEDDVPTAQICALYPSYWNSEFGPADNPAQHECVAALQAFVRSGVSRNQYYEGDLVLRGSPVSGARVDARVLNFDDDNQLEDYQDIAVQCALAFGTRVEELLYVDVCTRDARLIESVLEVDEPTGVAPSAGVGTCAE